MMDIERAGDVDKITLSKVDGAKADLLKKDICILCNNRFFRNQDYATLSCGQAYHMSCLDIALADVG